MCRFVCCTGLAPPSSSSPEAAVTGGSLRDANSAMTGTSGSAISRSGTSDDRSPFPKDQEQDWGLDDYVLPGATPKSPFANQREGVAPVAIDYGLNFRPF
jgi:hypothetical protein